MTATLLLSPIVNFGLRVAQNYLSGLHDCFELLADNQSFGTDCGFIAPGLLRYEYRSHSIYYQPIGQVEAISQLWPLVVSFEFDKHQGKAVDEAY